MIVAVKYGIFLDLLHLFTAAKHNYYTKREIDRRKSDKWEKEKWEMGMWFKEGVFLIIIFESYPLLSLFVTELTPLQRIHQNYSVSITITIGLRAQNRNPHLSRENLTAYSTVHDPRVWMTLNLIHLTRHSFMKRFRFEEHF